MTTTTPTDTTARLAQAGLVGALTANLDLRTSQHGNIYATGRIAVRPWLRGADEQPPAEFVDIVCFGGLAEHAAATVKKGDRIVVTGRLEDDVWTGRDGTERSGSKLLVDALGLDLRFRSTTTKATESSVLGTFGLPATTELHSDDAF